MTAPLAGVRIIDLTRLLPGPAATMHLADYGAAVIKVEDTGDGDYMRGFPPTVGSARGAPVNPAFEAINRGKRSIRIDLKRPEGRDVFVRLVERADAVIESFRPGVLARLQLDWDSLHAINPRMVLCSISGYGQTGPLSQRAGHDLNYIAMTGVLDQNRAHGAPAIPNLQMGDVLGGTLSALSALLIALLAAQRTGQGRAIDVAMSDGLLTHHFFAHADVDAGAPPRAEEALLTGGVACYRVYQTADSRHLAVGALEHKFWQAFCQAAGLPELVSHHWSYGEAPGTAAARGTIAAVAAAIARKTSAEWESVFEGVDACVTPVLTPEEALRHPHHLSRHLVRRAGAVTEVGPLARMSGHEWRVAAAPAAGEHTAGVLAELGYSDEAIRALLASGVAKGR